MIKLIGEIGINTNGCIEDAKKLARISAAHGFGFVKIQKRDPDSCVPEHQKYIKRMTPWGELNYIDYKKKIEFSAAQVDQLNKYCNGLGIKLFASVWDLKSAVDMAFFFDIVKIPSALITDFELLRFCRRNFKYLIISTGMSTEKEIEEAVSEGKPDAIFHSTASYPTKPENVHLNYIRWLTNKYPDKKIGYSGHEIGLHMTFSAASMGVDYIERHITLDRYQWGSDQLASIDPVQIAELSKGVNDIYNGMGEIQARELQEDEKKKQGELRK